MNSLKQLVIEEKFEERPASLRRLLDSHHARELSLKALFASHEMLTEYTKSLVWMSALGPIDGQNGVFKDNSGSYRINAKLGHLLKPLNAPPQAMGEYQAEVTLAGVRCFGTDDPGGLVPARDEIYGFVTLFSLIPGKQQAVGPPVMLPLTRDVKVGSVLFTNTPIGVVPLISGANGIKIHMTLWDEELLGSPEEAAEKVRSALVKFLLVLAGASGAVAAALPGVGAAAGAVAGSAALGVVLLENEDVSEFLKPVFEELTASLQDELLGEKTFTVNLDKILEWSTQEGFEHSLIPPPGSTPNELGAGVTFNTPVDIHNPMWLFNKGGDSGATYKAFFKVRPRGPLPPFPIDKG